MLFAKNVEIIDISVGGVSLRTDRNLDVGTGYILRIEWGEKGLTVKGEVKWSSPVADAAHPEGGSGILYKIGMKFSDIQEEDIRSIIRFVRREKKVSPEEEEELLEKVKAG